MSFSCPNYDEKTDACHHFEETCIPGRPDCVLDGKVIFSKKPGIQIEGLKLSNKEKGRQQKDIEP